MDIEFLLLLQGIREAAGPALEMVMNVISETAAGTITMLIPLTLFWCVDKALAVFAGINFAFGGLLNQALKNTFCIYRPWIRDPRIVPSQDALPDATGYSFPSGHTQCAFSVYGGLGWKLREKSRVVCFLLFLLSVLVAFSRNFLGVHTPQDVIVGAIEAIVVMAIVEKLMGWAEAKEGRDIVIAAVLVVLSLALVAYGTLRPYPMDYVDGELLVDPAAMIKDCYKMAGAVIGIGVGWVAERRLVGFSTEGIRVPERIMRFLVGVAVMLPTRLFLDPLIRQALGPWWGAFVAYLLLCLGGFVVAPAIFEAIGKRVWPREEAPAQGAHLRS